MGGSKVHKKYKGSTKTALFSFFSSKFTFLLRCLKRILKTNSCKYIMSNCTPRSKVFSISVALLFFAANCVLAYAHKSNFWAERQKKTNRIKSEPKPQTLLSSLPSPFLRPNTTIPPLPENIDGRYSKLINSLPLAYGNVRNISIPEKSTDEKIVIHIQDVHLNLEAQTNIGKAIQELIDNNLVDLVALEGAFGGIDLARFRLFKDKEALTKALDYSLREHKISGPIHTALTSPNPIPLFVGVDDRLLYQDNVEAYKKSPFILRKC